MKNTIVRLPEVMELTGLSRSSIIKETKLSRFPRPMQLTERAVGWRREEIAAWLEARPRAGEAA